MNNVTRPAEKLTRLQSFERSTIQWLLYSGWQIKAGTLSTISWSACSTPFESLYNRTSCTRHTNFVACFRIWYACFSAQLCSTTASHRFNNNMLIFHVPHRCRCSCRHQHYKLLLILKSNAVLKPQPFPLHTTLPVQ